MNTKKQTLILIIAMAATAAYTVWSGNSDLRRYREHGAPQSALADKGHGRAAGGETLARQDVAAYLNEQNAMMAGMMKNMERVGESGSASIDFLNGMIPHHESAIAMAELYLRSGGANQALADIAEDIISAQTGEIEQMNAIARRIKESGDKDEAKEQAYLKAYRAMLSNHHAGHGSAEKSIDDAFAEGMIMHHQMAVDMAKDILSYTDDAETRALAKSIIAAQEREIRKMRESLAGA